MVTYFTGPQSTLTVNVTKDIESLSLVVRWDAVEDFIDTTYTLAWISESNPIPVLATLTEQTSYTITGLTLDTVYTITVIPANMCGDGPEFRTSITFAAGNTSTISSISPTVTASIVVSIISPTTTTTNTKIAPLRTSSSTEVTSYYVPSATTTSTEDTTSSKGMYYYCHYYIYCQHYTKVVSITEITFITMSRQKIDFYNHPGYVTYL